MTGAAAPSAASHLTAIYEALRTAALTGSARGQHGLATLAHRGLAAWVGEMQREAPARPSAEPPAPAAVAAATPTELTRVLAGIIVALTIGDTHAHA